MMATKTYCDICGVEIGEGQVCQGLQTVSGPIDDRKAERSLDEVCGQCLRRAFEPPAMPSPEHKVRELLQQPLGVVAMRHLSGTSLSPAVLVDDLLACIGANVHAIAKAVRR
jgi:hypothetical protein